MSERKIKVMLTRPQVDALKKTLSVIEGDPDWAYMMGDAVQMDTLYRAHNAIILASVRDHRKET